MANLFTKSNSNLVFFRNIRRLSSFNNNRTKFGLTSILNNNDDLNIWSENNWSEYAKQFKQSAQFPLPGKVGVILTNLKMAENGKQANQATDNKQQQQVLPESKHELELLFAPLPEENHILKLKEAGFASWYEDKMNADKNFKTNFELKAFKCPLSLVKDFQNYFRTQSIGDSPLTVITLSFRTDNDMATWSSKVETEREALLEKFVDTAKSLCAVLEMEGFWADYIDPTSGQPAKSTINHAAFYETDERFRNLGFEIVDYGCCKVISHHKWGTKTYVGCLLTTAKVDGKFVKEIMANFNAN